MRIENGYEIRGNLASVGRHYQVCDGNGKVLADIRGSIELALAKAKSLPAGDIKPPPEVKSPEPKVATEVAKPRSKSSEKKSSDEGK